MGASTSTRARSTPTASPPLSPSTWGLLRLRGHGRRREHRLLCRQVQGGRPRAQATRLATCALGAFKLANVSNEVHDRIAHICLLGCRVLNGFEPFGFCSRVVTFGFCSRVTFRMLCYLSAFVVNLF